MRICFATNNKHKLEEVKDVVLGRGIDIVSLDEIGFYEELPETRDTLEGNSLQKAEYLFEKCHIPCFSDDSGLETEALDGAPGVYSARYAGSQRSSEDNMVLLLKNLEGKINRRARFRTVIALIGLEPSPVLFEGVVVGTIIEEKRGAGGFGYDPIFVPTGHTKTFAEMALEQKSEMSHRAIAVRKLETYLKEWLADHAK